MKNLRRLKLTACTVFGTLSSKNMPFYQIHLLDILIFEILNLNQVINFIRKTFLCSKVRFLGHICFFI